MAKFYYGNGECTIEGSDKRGVEIRYKGAIEIEDKTSSSFAISHQRNGIMIFPIGRGVLNELFTYMGTLKIASIIVANSNGERVPTSINKMMDYTELLKTNSEDMTTKSEDLSADNFYGKKVNKTILKQPNLNNLHTSDNTILYLEDGTLYQGSYHIHLSDNSAMTGREHKQDSKDLYYADGKPTKNSSLIPNASIEYGRKNRLNQKRRNILRNSTR